MKKSLGKFHGRTTIPVLVSAVLALAITGCAPISSQSKTAVRRVPAPVTEQGMTMDWGHDIKTTALKMIQSSQTYCYLDMYELSDPDILQALIDARHRNVDVRVVVDATEQHSQETAVPTLSHAGVPVKSLHIHRGISHIKMLIADGSVGGVLIGGMNYGASSWDNNDASVYLPHPNPSFHSVFQFDWQRAGNHPASAPSVQLPLLNERMTEQHVVTAIQTAKKSISLEAFNLSDANVLDSLVAASRRGVFVEVLLDPHQSQNRSTATKLRQAGATVRFYKSYENEWMHAKILDVDHGSTFIIGSANFSHQAYTYNHEGDLELHGFSEFDKSLEQNMTLQIERGTDNPEHPTR